MTTLWPHDGDARLETLTTEIERWNLQINLVSRVCTRKRVPALVEQCRVGWELAASALVGESWFDDAAYFDLGSGAGLPGLVWGTARSALGHSGATVLVEPRDKRAWFLRRTARLLDLDDISVQQSRWGEEVTSVAGESVLVSLKALRLDDGQVLEGLIRQQGDQGMAREVAILRFLDPARHSRDWLEESFAVPERVVGGSWQRLVIETLGHGDPRLLLTRYLAL